MKIRMHATYETTLWESEDDAEPTLTSGYTNPCNPWGGWKSEMPERAHGPELAAWVAENVQEEVFTSVADAAEFVAEFSGAVWDLVPDCSPNIDYRTGEETTVTLHVIDHAYEVLAAAKVLMAEQDAHLAALRAAIR